MIVGGQGEEIQQIVQAGEGKLVCGNAALSRGQQALEQAGGAQRSECEALFFLPVGEHGICVCCAGSAG